MNDPRDKPTPDELYAFETTGYLAIPGFLTPPHVARLTDALETSVERRRRLSRDGHQFAGETQIDGESTRIFCILEDHPEFLEMIDYPPLMPYVHALLSPRPHFHASDAIQEIGPGARDPQWHMDGGYFRVLPRPIPHMQLKVGYYLSDMREPDQGNLILVPGSHRNTIEPDAAQRKGFDTIPGAVQVCGPPGTAVMFHNAVWHTGGPRTKPTGRRLMLYYAYEHGFMVGNPEHWSFSKDFYAGLSPARRKLFHGFVFDPPERRFS